MQATVSGEPRRSFRFSSHKVKFLLSTVTFTILTLLRKWRVVPATVETMDPACMDQEFRRIAESFQQKAKLTPEQIRLFKLTKVEDVKGVLAELQNNHESRRACVWLKRLDPFINTMLEFGSIVEVFLNTSDILCFIWVSFLISLSGR